ncbi:MAG TPA: hypothetical protein VLD37_00030 [Candidatus Bilamarchaeum sp.]|nr:hypothetical protein [Candidatus Bilamarchaeum sp.]
MDIEGELLKSVPRDELERLAKERIKSFHGFLTREVALRLIAKERGILRPEEEKECKVSEIPKGGKRISLRATVKKIWPAATYSSGKRSRVVEIGDETGTKPLVLWNEDIKLGDRLRLSDEVMVRNVYERSGELHLGYSGTITVVRKAGFSGLASLRDGESAHVRGVVSSVDGTDTFIKGKAPVWGFAFGLSDSSGERRCIIFEGLDRAQRIRKGDEVRIESATVDNGNLYIGADSRIMAKRAGDSVAGIISAIESEGERLRLTVEGREYEFARDGALAALGVKAAPDIALSTVVGLKKDKLLNSRIVFKIQDGHVVVRG